MRPRGGRLPFLLAGFLTLASGSGAAWPAMGGGHAGIHANGAGGARCLGASGPRGQGVRGGRFGSPLFAGRHIAGGRFARHRFAGHHDFPYIAYAPYWYDPDYGDEAQAPDEAPAHRSPGAGFCDVSPHSYPQDCVWKDRP